jgi:hypothetical protein
MPYDPDRLPADSVLARTYGLPEFHQHRLERSRHRKIVEALAANASLLPQVQLELAQHGRVVCEILAGNPGLVEAGQIALIQRGHPRVMAVMAARRDLGAEVQRRLVSTRGDNHQRNLARNPTVVPDVQPALATHALGSIRAALAGNLSVDPQLLPALAADADRRVRIAAAGNRHLAPPEQRSLAGGRSGRARARLAGNPALTPEVQLRLAEGPEPQVLLVLARNPSLSAAAADRLNQGDTLVRQEVARNPALPRGLMRRMLDEGSLDVSLAANSRIGAAEQRILAARSQACRVVLAGADHLDRSLAVQLAEDPEPGVRQALAGNRALALPVVAALAEDPVDAVRQAIAHRRPLDPTVQRVLSVDPVDKVRIAMASIGEWHMGWGTADREEMGRLDVGAQRRLAADRSPEVRERIARHARLDPQAQRLLVGDPVVDVRWALAGNPVLLAELQPALAVDPNWLVRSRLLGNSALSREGVRVFVEDWGSSRHTDRAGIRHRHDIGSPAHWKAASLNHEILGPLIAAAAGLGGVLRAAALHPDPLVRAGLMANESARGEHVEALLHDGDPLVRAAAQRRFVRMIAAA